MKMWGYLNIADHHHVLHVPLVTPSLPGPGYITPLQGSFCVKWWFFFLWIYSFWLHYLIRLGLPFSKRYNTWCLLWILWVKRIFNIWKYLILNIKMHITFFLGIWRPWNKKSIFYINDSATFLLSNHLDLTNFIFS